MIAFNIPCPIEMISCLILVHCSYRCILWFQIDIKSGDYHGHWQNPRCRLEAVTLPYCIVGDPSILTSPFTNFWILPMVMIIRYLAQWFNLTRWWWSRNRLSC